MKVKYINDNIMTPPNNKFCAKHMVFQENVPCELLILQGLSPQELFPSITG